MRVRARQERRRDERGGISLMAIPAVAIIVTMALVFITMVGGFTSDRREVRAAADAAALAAAHEWDAWLEFRFDEHQSAGDFADFWALVGCPVLPGSGMGAPAHCGPSPWDVRSRMEARANELAQRNGAQLETFEVDVSQQRVSVTVRHEDVVAETSTRLAASATAEVELDGALCISGGRLGYQIGAVCLSDLIDIPDPPEPPGDDDDEDDEDDDEEDFEPPTLSVFRSTVRLVE